MAPAALYRRFVAPRTVLVGATPIKTSILSPCRVDCPVDHPNEPPSLNDGQSRTTHPDLADGSEIRGSALKSVEPLRLDHYPDRRAPSAVDSISHARLLAPPLSTRCTFADILGTSLTGGKGMTRFIRVASREVLEIEFVPTSHAAPRQELTSLVMEIARPP